MANLESSCCDYCCCKGKNHKGGGNFTTMILIEQPMATDDVFHGLHNLWVISLGSSPNFYNVSNLPTSNVTSPPLYTVFHHPTSKVSSPPSSTRLNLLASNQPPPTSSLIPPLLHHPSPCQRSKLPISKNNISPAADKIKINENIPLIKISNPIQKNRKRFSKLLLTVNNKTTTNIQKETAICNQHTSSSSVGISTDSDSSFHTQQPKRKNINLSFADNDNRDSYIALPTKIVTIRNHITNNTFNDNNSSDSEFSLSRFNKRRRYCSKKIR